MNKFSNKLKKPCFWPISGSFSQFLRQKKVSWKIQLCHTQLHMGFQLHAKIQKKSIYNSKKMPRQTEGQKDGQKDGQPILQDPSRYCWGYKKILFMTVLGDIELKNFLSHSTMGPTFKVSIATVSLGKFANHF